MREYLFHGRCAEKNRANTISDFNEASRPTFYSVDRTTNSMEHRGFESYTLRPTDQLQCAGGLAVRVVAACVLQWSATSCNPNSHQTKANRWTPSLTNANSSRQHGLEPRRCRATFAAEKAPTQGTTVSETDLIDGHSAPNSGWRFGSQAIHDSEQSGYQVTSTSTAARRLCRSRTESRCSR